MRSGNSFRRTPLRRVAQFRRWRAARMAFAGGVQMILGTLLGFRFPIVQAPVTGMQASAPAVGVSNTTPVSRPRLPAPS